MNYIHLTINERCCIYQFKLSGMSIRQIARALQRSPSTISRELKRNSYKTGIHYSITKYSPNIAQSLANIRHSNSHRKLEWDTSSLEYIQDRLLENWSFEQIANRENKDIHNIPSTSSIYRYIHKGLLNKVTMRNLRRKGNFKRPAEKRGKFNDGGRTIKKEIKVYINVMN
ncbi:MAG: helix-turn-helix domain-containing protein [Erysipelotrichaceae bacterium]|nr:helix-turn-helix domain-containing protein [Erysipelotrichaceae bacterium]